MVELVGGGSVALSVGVAVAVAVAVFVLLSGHIKRFSGTRHFGKLKS